MSKLFETIHVFTYHKDAIESINRLSKIKGMYLTYEQNGFRYDISNKYDPKYLRGLEKDKLNIRFGTKRVSMPVLDTILNTEVSNLHIYNAFKKYCRKDVEVTKQGEEVFKNTYSRPDKTACWVNLYYSKGLGKVITGDVDYVSEYKARRDISTISTITHLKTVKVWK